MSKFIKIKDKYGEVWIVNKRCISAIREGAVDYIGNRIITVISGGWCNEIHMKETIEELWDMFFKER